MEDVRKNFSPEQIKKAWAYGYGRDCWEFHGPSGEYHYGLRGCDCLWSAKSAGWDKLMAEKEKQ